MRSLKYLWTKTVGCKEIDFYKIKVWGKDSFPLNGRVTKPFEIGFFLIQEKAIIKLLE